VDRVSSKAVEGLGTVTAELDDFVDVDEVLSDIKDEVDRISDFPPADAEEPSVTKSSTNANVMTLVVYGDASERAIRENAEHIQEALLLLPGVSLVNLEGVRSYDISIDVSEDVLRQYGLPLSEIATAVSNTTLALPACPI